MLVLVRCLVLSGVVIGRLFYNDVFVCYTLENRSLMIPCGTYPVTLDVQSPKFRLRYPYRTFCNGYLPRVLVPGRNGILFHIGTRLIDTKGCILLGDDYDAASQQLFFSTRAFVRFYKLIQDSKDLKLTIQYL